MITSETESAISRGAGAELTNRKLILLLALAAFIVLPGSLMQSAHAQASSITSAWTNKPPFIDGKIVAGEWSNLQITIEGPSYPDNYVKPTFVYFMNDQSRLYVLVDAAGDPTDDSLDECLLVFGFAPRVDIEIIGASGTQLNVNFDAAVGFYPSPNNATAHKIYEFSIPFSYINAQPGQPIDFSSPLSLKHIPGGSMPYDATTFHDNIWPVGLVEGDAATYSTLGLGSQPAPVAPVGGYMEPAKKLAVVAPYLALFGVLAVVVVAVIPWKKREK